MQRISAEISEYVSRRLGESTKVHFDGTVLKIEIEEIEAHFSINIEKTIQAIERRKDELQKRVKQLLSRIRRTESRVKEVLEAMGSPEVVRYVRCKLYGGRPGFAIVARRISGGVALYKVISRRGRKSWIRIEGVNADEWFLLEDLLEDLRELRSELSRVHDVVRELYAPLGVVMDVVDVMRHVMSIVCQEMEMPELPELPSSEEDPFYEELLELELVLLRRRRRSRELYE
ncbi:MAG: hypothetical protein DRN15_05015 [Thermoprotei archaeon]|nr:MAG: hypothetical protein DRN15_05015 [Thermoprotei archaeon]